MADAPDANARCPRCGGGFHCGAQEASCPCAAIELDALTLGALRARHEGCLCLDCLRAAHASALAGGGPDADNAAPAGWAR